MDRITKIATFIFAIFWMLFILADYWQKHPVYPLAFQHFQYWGFSIMLLLTGGGLSWWVLKSKAKKKIKWLNGLFVFGLFMFINVASVGFAYGQFGGNGFRAAKVIGLLGSTSLVIYALVLTSYTLGSLATSKLRLDTTGQGRTVIDLAAGFFALSILLFILGSVSLLYSWAIFPAFIAILFLGRKNALRFLRTTLWQPLPLDQKLNWAGAGCAFLLLATTCVNFTAVNVPMPSGFDALTHYANIPSLIGQQNGLVEGYQPYNWSLLMSLGHILFDSTAISLAISWLGGPLALGALYVLCRKWLKIDVNYTFATLLVFSLTPAFWVQSTAELKIDLGLLFVYLSILLLFLQYAQRFTKEKIEAPNKLFSPDLLLMALLTGFALGIKLTTVYFAFSLFAGLCFVHARWRGFLAAFLFCLFLVFIARLDDFGGLRQYHIGVEKLQWGIFAAAIFLAVGAFFENKKGLIKSVRSAAVFGIFLFIPFLPWAAKNYIETKSLSPQSLMNGKVPAPEIDWESLMQSPGN